MKPLRLTLAGLLVFLSSLPVLSQAIAPEGPQNLLILPFRNDSKAPGLDWIAESFPEVLGERMASSLILVVPRDDRVYAFDHSGIPASLSLSRITLYQIAEQMDADFVVMGSFNYDGQTFTAKAQLLDMKRLHLSSPVEESGPLLKMVDVQRSLAWDLLRDLKAPLLPEKDDFLGQSSPVRLDALESYVRGVMANNRPEKLERFRNAVKINPFYVEAQYQLGKTLIENKEYEPAAAAFAKVPRTDALGGEASFYRGLAAYYAGDYAQAEDAFTNVANSMPLTEVYNNLAVVAGRRGKRTEIEFLQKAVTSDPNDPDYHFNMAIALHRLGDNQGAIRNLKEALEAKPGDTEAKNFLNALSATINPPGLAVGPSNTVRVPASRMKRNYDETSYRQLALEIERAAEVRFAQSDGPSHARYHLDRGRDFLKQGFIGEADRHFREAIQLDPTNDAAHLGLAQVLSTQGNSAGAIREAQAALRLNPTANAWVMLARENLKTGKFDLVEAELRHALTIDPNNSDAKAVQDALATKRPAAVAPTISN